MKGYFLKLSNLKYTESLGFDSCGEKFYFWHLLSDYYKAQNLYSDCSKII